jgi:hypothetical protein
VRVPLAASVGRINLRLVNVSGSGALPTAVESKESFTAVLCLPGLKIRSDTSSVRKPTLVHDYAELDGHVG